MSILGATAEIVVLSRRKTNLGKAAGINFAATQEAMRKTI